MAFNTFNSILLFYNSPVSITPKTTIYDIFGRYRVLLCNQSAEPLGLTAVREGHCVINNMRRARVLHIVRALRFVALVGRRCRFHARCAPLKVDLLRSSGTGHAGLFLGSPLLIAQFTVFFGHQSNVEDLICSKRKKKGKCSSSWGRRSMIGK